MKVQIDDRFNYKLQPTIDMPKYQDFSTFKDFELTNNLIFELLIREEPIKTSLIYLYDEIQDNPNNLNVERIFKKNKDFFNKRFNSTQFYTYFIKGSLTKNTRYFSSDTTVNQVREEAKNVITDNTQKNKNNPLHLAFSPITPSEVMNSEYYKIKPLNIKRRFSRPIVFRKSSQNINLNIDLGEDIESIYKYISHVYSNIKETKISKFTMLTNLKLQYPKKNKTKRMSILGKMFFVYDYFNFRKEEIEQEKKIYLKKYTKVQNEIKKDKKDNIYFDKQKYSYILEELKNEYPDHDIKRKDIATLIRNDIAEQLELEPDTIKKYIDQMKKEIININDYL